MINHQKQLENYIENIKISSNSIKNMMDVTYYARLLQISALYPSILTDFNFYKGNMSLVTNSLQTHQF